MKEYYTKPSLIFGLGKIHHLPFSRLRQKIIREALDIGIKSFDIAPS